MPTFKTAPEPDSSVRSPYDDLNRLERNGDRNSDKAPPPDQGQTRQLDRADERNPADARAQDRLERVLERNGGMLEREPERAHAAPAKPVLQVPPPARKQAEGNDPLIEGLFSKLPTPESEWPLQARQKWLQTAANIFDLMYTPGSADAGELAIRVERSNGRV